MLACVCVYSVLWFLMTFEDNSDRQSACQPYDPVNNLSLYAAAILPLSCFAVDLQHNARTLWDAVTQVWPRLWTVLNCCIKLQCSFGLTPRPLLFCSLIHWLWLWSPGHFSQLKYCKSTWSCRNSSNVPAIVDLCCAAHDEGLSFSFRFADILREKNSISIAGFHERADLRQPRYALLRAIVSFALANKGKLWGELLDRE